MAFQSQPLSSGKPSRRWLILILAGTLFILSQFYRSSVAVIAPNLVADLKLDAWELSTVSASFFYAFALMQIPVGMFLDTIGPRITMTALTLVSVAGAFLFATGDSYHYLALGRAMLGIGMACNFMGTLKLITIWFKPNQFATLSAVIVSAGTVGNIFAATPLVLMVQAMGWRNSFLTISGVSLVMAFSFFILVKDRSSQPTATNDRTTTHPSVRQTLQRGRTLFSRRDFWIISFSTFCRYGIFASVQSLWAGPYLINVAGLSGVATGNIILLMSIGMIIGSPISGHLSDQILNSRKRVIVPGLLGMAGILGILIFLPPNAGKMTLSLLFLGFGLVSSSGQVMYAHIKEQVPLENAGMAMTGINFFTMAGVAVFLQGLGSLMKFLYPGTSLGPGAFRGAFVFCSVCLTLIGMFYTLTSETMDKKKE
ncbi:putative hexose phosphate transport protein [Desulforapulum autotrophicum HRM2]|uniref:Lysosomal dipeptide transporter MFSD1 n=1 Tax=Desulforapulum autotrophicum (strain ATCC 43914 / DSM 3382 / VKM B-1955 / HRM2) TaxID=177437 RepID=C0QJ81_DESAH|nr:MFS transporter [Desulforapulum autotrophicum]ACN15894.1 putative hexose phosphate transport protein [Desulforapulum autotrophicum HRM2]